MLIKFNNTEPEVDPAAFITEGTYLIGSVKVGPKSSVWYGSVLRGDISPIIIGEGTNIQDNSTIHVDHKLPCIVGNYVTVGHNVVLHACTIEDEVLIGMGATILDGAVISKGSIVGANALVPQGFKVPPNSMALGVPAKIVRTLKKGEWKAREHAQAYIDLAEEYRKS